MATVPDWRCLNPLCKKLEAVWQLREGSKVESGVTECGSPGGYRQESETLSGVHFDGCRVPRLYYRACR